MSGGKPLYERILVVDIGKVTVGNQSYYTDQVVESMEEYYSMQGESPGKYFGELTNSLVMREKLHKFVDAADFQSLLAGRSPGDSEPLGSTVADRKVLGFDMVFRAPKSVSLMFAIGDPLVQKNVEEAHDLAVKKAFKFIQPHIAATRSGKGGLEKVDGKGVAGAAFKHRTSRELDPLLHTHNVVFNYTPRVTDGAFRALDSARIYRWGKLAGYVYQAELRAQLTQRLGVEWGRVKNGLADVDGVPKPVIKHFSKRRSEIKNELDNREEASPREHQLAALRTRRPKESAPENLEDFWIQESAELGFTAQTIQELCGARQQLAVTAPDFDAIERELLGPKGLTAKKATFDFREVVMQAFDLVDPATPPEVVTEFATRFVERFGVAVNVDVAEFVKTGMHTYRNTGEAVYSTSEMLTRELNLIEAAGKRQDDGSACLAPHLVARMMSRDSGVVLNKGQEAMVRQIVGSGNGVEIVVGDAGTGKTFALGRAREIFEERGIRVIGATIAHSASHELQKGAGIPSRTVSSRLLRIKNHGPEAVFGTDGNCVLVVDEAGMVGTRDLADLVHAAGVSGAKVVLVGDDKQLQSIDAGGAFGVLERHLGAVRLSENMRQEDPIDREIISQLEHDGAKAFELAVKHRRVLPFESTGVATAELVDTWAASAYRSNSLVLASRNADVDALNLACQSRRLEMAELQEQSLELCGARLHVGDRVVFRENDRQVGFVNHDFGEVTAINPENGQIVIRLDRTAAELRITEGMLSGDRAIRLGYASTVHVAEGRTVDAAFGLLTSDLNKEYLTVLMTRHRKELATFGAKREIESLAGFGPELDDDGLKELKRPFTTEDRKRMAIDFEGIRAIDDDPILDARIEAFRQRMLDSPTERVVESIGRPPTTEAAREKWSTSAAMIEIDAQHKLDLKDGQVADLKVDPGIRPILLELMGRDARKLAERELKQTRQVRGPRMK